MPRLRFAQAIELVAAGDAVGEGVLVAHDRWRAGNVRPVERWTQIGLGLQRVTTVVGRPRERDLVSDPRDIQYRPLNYVRLPHVFPELDAMHAVIGGEEQCPVHVQKMERIRMASAR